MRQLKFHEQKLLKKVDFLSWKSDNQQREVSVLRKYHVQNREDYSKYNKICGLVKQVSHAIAKLEPQDEFRRQMVLQLLDKLYTCGLIPMKQSLSQCEKLTVSAFCRRRLPVVLVRLKMAETLREAVTLIEQGHIRVGLETVTDPAFFITRSMEDFVTWVDSSKIKRKILKYNDKLDDFDLL